MEELTTQDHVSSNPADQVTAVLLLLGGFQGSDRELRLLRPGREVALGRGRPDGSADEWRVDDPTVSRRHARLIHESGAFFLEDLGSRNGTWVDGVHLRGQKMRLRSGSLIVMGGEAAVFRRMTADELSAIRTDDERPLGPVPTASPLLASALRRLRLLARTDQPILLAGETGVGKEVYARAVHGLSGRGGLFVAVNCASFQRELFESQLFGYKRGSHSQATEDNPGILATAENGTLFLDEIGEMDPALQTKLLRFLQEKTFFGLGATRPKKADVRILAATQSPKDTLRKDILGRLGAEAVTLPTLRRRKEDIPALCRHFLRQSVANSGVVGFERDTCLALCLYRWPRNIRELQSVLVEAVLSAADRGASRIGLRDLPGRMRDLSAPPHQSGSRSSDQIPDDDIPDAPSTDRLRPTRAQLEQLLRTHAGQVPAVARHLQRRREVVWRWCRVLSIDPTMFKVESDQGGGETAIGPATGRATGRRP
jgi:transcriptional regulator with PAS, ATPase and Fis domain